MKAGERPHTIWRVNAKMNGNWGYLFCLPSYSVSLVLNFFADSSCSALKEEDKIYYNKLEQQMGITYKD